MTTRYALRTSEPLAISADAVRRDADGFFLLLGGDPPENETLGSVVIVKIRGALQQFKGSGGDSYEAIEERVEEAFAADPKPSAVLLHISSPGGLVAGLNECVACLRRRSKEVGIPLIAYAGELAASAAYALCCACSEILAPKSGIVGSVGVISTMISCAKRDATEGIDFRIITSGKRKADGHLHVPITDDAAKAEMARNDDMAAQFFALAGKARGQSPAKLRALEAAIYMGKKAKAVGLIDDVIGLDDALLGLDRSEIVSKEAVAPNEGNVTDRRAREPKSVTTLDKSQQGTPHSGTAHGGTNVPAPGEAHMSVKLDALIKKTEAAISTERDPKKLRSLQASLAAFAATRAEMDGDDDGDGDEDDDDESKAKKAAEEARKAKAKAESAKHRAKAAEHKSKAAEYEEAAKKAEEEAKGGAEDEEEEARLRTPAPLALGSAAEEIVASQAGTAAEALKRVEALEARAAERERKSVIAKLVAERRVTPGEAKKWDKRPASFWSQVEEMRPHALVITSDDALHSPNETPNADVPASVKRMVDQAVLASGKAGKEADDFREALIADHRKAQAKTNGAGAY